MSVRRTTATAPQGEAQVTTGAVPTKTSTRAGDPRTWQEAVYDHQAFSAQTLASLGADSPEAGQAGLDELAAAGYLAEVAR
ncbi:hypothetical protein OIE71_34760 (plasmid) [Streptomyces sp. NBC_01725]|uniref:hypothetical protein n=1 Tax=Streptomyces sp. NBC_01725 TaxID=2975923 RepID=UPI002E27BAA5|nr:hypothetical protein [Streptomyces sp. NBC_01725]